MKRQNFAACTTCNKVIPYVEDAGSTTLTYDEILKHGTAGTKDLTTNLRTLEYAQFYLSQRQIGIPHAAIRSVADFYDKNSHAAAA